MLITINKQTIKSINWADGATKLIVRQLLAQNWIVQIDEDGCVVAKAPKFTISIKSSDFPGFKGWIKALKLNGGFDDSQFNKRISQTQSRIEVQAYMKIEEWKEIGSPKWKISKSRSKLINYLDYEPWQRWQGIIRLPPYTVVWLNTLTTDLPQTFRLRIETLPIIKNEEIKDTNLDKDLNLKKFVSTRKSKFNFTKEPKIQSISNYPELLKNMPSFFEIKYLK